MRSRFALLLTTIGFMGTASAAVAQDESFPKFSGNVAFVSEYRFRGVSMSNKDPAVQGALQMTTKPGFFVAAWGSSIAEYAGATTEIDVYGGWSGPIGPLTTTVGIYSYLYPGGSNVDVVELYGSVAGSYGPATLTVGINWAPDQDNLNRSSRYAYGLLTVAVPNTPFTLKGSIAHEQGALVVDPTGRTTKKLDYMVGVDTIYKNLTLGLSFVGNDLPEKDDFNPNAKNRFLVTLTAAF